MREDAPRPTFVPKTQIDANWARTFAPQPAAPQYACPHGNDTECKQCKRPRRRPNTSIPAIHADKRTR